METEILAEIRDLLRLIAEPQLAERDAKHRQAIREIAGQGKKKQDAILLMNGDHDRKFIIEKSTIDASGLTRLVQALDGAGVLQNREPARLSVLIPHNFFEGD